MATQEFFRLFTSVLDGFEQPNKPFHAFHQSASRVSFFQGCTVTFNPLPHGGRPFWPITSLHANSSKCAEGKVSSKNRYSSSRISGLFWTHNNTYLGPNKPVINFLVNHSGIGGYGWPPPWWYSLLINCYYIENSLTAEVFLAQQIGGR